MDTFFVSQLGLEEVAVGVTNAFLQIYFVVFLHFRNYQKRFSCILHTFTPGRWYYP